MDARPHEAIGKLMAQRALALLAPGAPITVITRDTATFKNPAADIQMASFRKTVNQANAAIGWLHALQVDPLRPIAVPSSEFCEAIRATPEGGVIVSFMGPPRLTQAERTRLGNSKPAIVAFCPGSLPELANLPSLFKQGLLKAAVVERPGAEQQAAENGLGPPEPSFLTITASNLAELATFQGSEH